MNVNADNLPVLSAALAAGLYPKLLSLDVGSGGLKTITNQQPAAIVSDLLLKFESIWD